MSRKTTKKKNFVHIGLNWEPQRSLIMNSKQLTPDAKVELIETSKRVKAMARSESIENI